MFWEDNSIVIGMLQEFKKDTTGITINSEYNIFKQMRDEVDTMCDIFDSGTNLLLHSMYVVSNWKIVDFDDYDNVYVVQSLLYPIRLCSEFIATIHHFNGNKIRNISHIMSPIIYLSTNIGYNEADGYDDIITVIKTMRTII